MKFYLSNNSDLSKQLERKIKYKKKNASNLIQLSSLINEFYVKFVYIVIINKILIQHLWIFVYIVINEFYLLCQIFYLLSDVA